MENKEIEYKPLYTTIFSAYYFIEGMNTSMFAVVVPIYLLNLIGTIDASTLAFLASVVMMPWAIKFLYGIMGDKIGHKQLGRRKPWIIGTGFLSGITWIIIPLIIQPNESAIMVFTIGGLFIMLGAAMGDTSLDGFILDICPKQQLGRTQGFCWGFRSVGTIAGGPLMAFIITILNAELMFMIFGILTIIFSISTIIINHIEIPEVEIRKNFKKMFLTKKNWKVYLWSFFDSVVDDVIILFVALFLLIQMGFVQSTGASIDLLEEDVNLYIPQANINLIVSIGIIIGALAGGTIADKKSRKFAVYLGYLIAISSVFLILLNWGVFFLIVFAIIIGLGWGWRNASYSAVLGEISKQYPEMDSTFFSIGTSFANIGAVVGLVIAGALFDVFSNLTTNFLVIYAGVFIFMAIFQGLAPLMFSRIKSNEYEFKINI